MTNPMTTNAVTVVVPVLNAADSIRACMDSILRQTKKELEILCVDAESTDGTWEILEEYAGSDSRVRLLRSDRKSYGYQVNLGIKAATGKYCGIVEADDEISPEMYEVLCNTAECTNAELVKADYYETYHNADGVMKTRRVPVLRVRELYGRLLNIAQQPLCMQPDAIAIWSGIYRKDYLENYSIMHNETPGASYQDMGFWAQTLFHAGRAYFLERSLYRYRIDNPTSSTWRMDKMYCICDEMCFVSERIRKYEENSGDTEHSAEGKILGKRDLLDRLCWIFYRKYKRNMERVPEGKMPMFFNRFAEDFKAWDERYGIGEKYFYEEEIRELRSIMQDPAAYDKEMNRSRENFLRECDSCGAKIIYGAGRVGRLLVSLLNDKEDILCYAVSDTPKHMEQDGIPIRNIHEIAAELQATRLAQTTEAAGSVQESEVTEAAGDVQESKVTEAAGGAQASEAAGTAQGKQIPLIIASKRSDYREEMYRMVQQLGFENIRMIPYGAFDL